MLPGYGYLYSFIKTEGIEKDLETRFDHSYYELDRPLSKAKNKKSN